MVVQKISSLHFIARGPRDFKPVEICKFSKEEILLKSRSAKQEATAL